MKKRIVIILILLAAIPTAVVALIATFSPKKGANTDVYSYEGITEKTTAADFLKLFPDAQGEGKTSYRYYFQDSNLTRWGCTQGEVKAITGKASFMPGTDLVEYITLSVVPNGRGDAIFKKIAEYFTKTLGQADRNDSETEYMWAKTDANVLLSYATDAIRVTYFYNLST